MNSQTFQNLPTKEVARLVRTAGSKVCVFPVNGTRRWFLLEHPPRSSEDVEIAYLDQMTECYVRLFGLIFNHGIDTLLSPIFGPDIMERGQEYTEMAVEGLTRLATHPSFLDLYQSFGVRVRFYGDYQKYLRRTPYAFLSDLFSEVTEKTRNHKRHRLFIGLFAQDATETTGEIAVQFYKDHGRPPNRREIVETYYGEFVEDVDFFIGCDRPTAYDMPLIATGNEDLYFTVAPSPYLDTHTLRSILYDHLYIRRVDENCYFDLTPTQWRRMADYYAKNRHAVLGLGRQTANGHFWYPLPQIRLPIHMINEIEERYAKRRNGRSHHYIISDRVLATVSN